VILRDGEASPCHRTKVFHTKKSFSFIEMFDMKTNVRK
jgi:hypothetical protein